MRTVSEAASQPTANNARARVIRRLRRIFAASVVALLAVLLIAAVNLYRLNETARLYSHTYEVLAELNQMQADVTTMESSARGWATLGEPVFRKHYAEGHKDFVKCLDHIQWLTRENPQQQINVQQLRAVYARWQRRYTEPLLRQMSAARGNATVQDLEKVAQLVTLARPYFEDMRTLTSAVELEENLRLNERTRDQNHSQRLAALSVLLSVLFIVLLLSTLLLMLDRSTGQVLDTNARLEAEIAERTAAQEELRASRANITALIENTSDLIWSVNCDYKLASYNRVFSEAMHQRFGQAPTLGQDIAVMFVGEGIRWKLWYDRAFAGEHFRVDISTERDGHIKDQELSFSPIETDGPDGIAVTGATVYARDITERKKIERLKNEFISTVSHELRTPLTSIRGSLGLLRGGVTGELPEAANSLVDIAVNNAERLVRLINDILDVEKIESGKMEFRLTPLELESVIHTALDGAEGYARELGVRFELRNELPDGARVHADADRLTQVMDNLLSNAAKFSHPGDTVLVTLSRQGSALRVSVQDNGPGVPPEFHARIFNRFAQADSSDTRAKGGTGLGLAIVSSIIEKLGGTIDFERTRTGGATFYFELPEWTPAPETKEQSAARRVLICEDQPDIAELLRMMLHQIGLEADIAPDLRTASECLHSLLQTADGLERTAYSAITLDLNLPDGDGASFIRTLRDDPVTRDLPVVVVSATATAGRDALQGDALGIVDWLEKPIDVQRLHRAVRCAAERATQEAGWRPRVLHVEDDDDIVRVAGEILKADAEMESAASLSAARAKLAQNVYDLIILDLALPDGDGLELLTQLNSTARRTPVVVFSAHQLSQQDALRTEAVLVKSRTSNETLLQTIQSLISKN